MLFKMLSNILYIFILAALIWHPSMENVCNAVIDLTVKFSVWEMKQEIGDPWKKHFPFDERMFSQFKSQLKLIFQ